MLQKIKRKNIEKRNFIGLFNMHMVYLFQSFVVVLDLSILS